ncbi:MAG: Tim44 domain-containing protein [Chromatiaceae bacterium]|nr:MAG: Tim44 domain-containing protein [Chromatiaceae bacterium]
MKTLLIALLTLVVTGSLLAPDTAEARRFGGGQSMGRQFSTPQRATPQRQAQPQRQQQADQQRGQQAGAAPTRTQPGARPGGASRWLGPLAGLAAGGLLASLFFGGAFEGFKFMDFLLIAALIGGGILLFRMLRRRSAPTLAARSGLPIGAGAGYGGRPLATPFPGPGTRGGGLALPDAGAGSAAAAPAWFDGVAFADGARTHFIRLQAAWDRSDFRDIRDYTAPELFAELKRAREAMGSVDNYTEVVRLEAELLGVQRDSERVVASVRFTGLIREEADGIANPLDEIWHVAHAWDSAEGDWQIIGIQQPQG